MKNQSSHQKAMATYTTLESRGTFVVPGWGWRNAAPVLFDITSRTWAWSWSRVNGWRERWSNWSWNGSGSQR